MEMAIYSNLNYIPGTWFINRERVNQIHGSLFFLFLCGGIDHVVFYVVTFDGGSHCGIED